MGSSGFFFKFIYFETEREKNNMSRRGAEREGERENPKQTLHFQHRAWCGSQAHESWDHDPSQNQELEAQPTEPSGNPRKGVCFNVNSTEEYKGETISSHNLPFRDLIPRNLYSIFGNFAFDN